MGDSITIWIRHVYILWEVAKSFTDEAEEDLILDGNKTKKQDVWVPVCEQKVAIIQDGADIAKCRCTTI